jgi:hypothetical protein
MVTQVQKIPGTFTLPADWPKFEYPDIETDLLFDWVAEDLTAGPFTGWKDRIAGNSFFHEGISTVGPPVVTDGTGPDGSATVTFTWDGTANVTPQRIRANFADLLGDVSIAVVYKANVISDGSARILSGAGGFRSIENYTTVNGVMLRGAAGASNIYASMGVPGAPEDQWNIVVGRWSESAQQMSGKALGGTLSTVPMVGQIQQTAFYIGGNTANPPGVGSRLNGHIARMSVWHRAVKDIDIDAILFSYSDRYGITAPTV